MSAKQTTDNFYEAWSNFAWPEPKPISYRCYYLPDGKVDFYTMEDLPGTYIEVSKEIYLTPPQNARIAEGTLQITPVRIMTEKLVPGQDAGTRCHPTDVCVVVPQDQPGTNWNIKQHDID